ncbi:MAG: 23S rRNA (uracil(1939)-C(5))-methyltransferase RlmD, partial [Thermodesulfobacteriota bacterium]
MNSLSENITEISTLVYGGDGLGRAADGRAVFVPYTVPGDRVRYHVRRAYKRYIKAELVEVLEPGDSRQKPLCPHFGTCGGCEWQMLSYARQCIWKHNLLAQNLVHIMGPEADKVLHEFLPAPDHTGYRCRAQLKCAEVAGTIVLGFYRSGTHKVTDLHSCPVLHPRLQALLEPLRQLLNRSPHGADISRIDISTGDNGGVRVVFHCLAKVDSFVKWVEKHTASWEAAILVVRATDISRQARPVCVQGREELSFNPDTSGLWLEYGARDFCQVNLAQNRALVAQVLAVTGVDERTTVYDLYCGVGNFALPLATQAGLVVGVEANAQAIKRAQHNACAHNLANTHFIAEDVGRFLADTPVDLPPADVVVMDPPRAGAKAAVTLLETSTAWRIVYISCDQQTMLRDITVLTRSGFVLKFVRG